MSNKEKEKNEFCLTNPDGKMQDVFESKKDFVNESKNFVKENNVADTKEQEYVPEQFVQTTQKQTSRGSTTNLISVSGFFATTAVAVASTVVIAIAVIAASIANFQLFAATGDSLTFYTQSYLDEEYSYSVILFNDDDSQEMIIERPFVEFYGLMPDKTYTAKIINTKTDEIVFMQEYKTAPQDYYELSFEAWAENNVMIIKTYQDSMPSVEGIEYYTISIYDAKGKNIFEKTTKELDAEYDFQLPENNSVTTDNTKPVDEVYYVGLVYKKGNHTIGRVQEAMNYNP